MLEKNVPLALRQDPDSATRTPSRVGTPEEVEPVNQANANRCETEPAKQGDATSIDNSSSRGSARRVPNGLTGELVRYERFHLLHRFAGIIHFYVLF